MPLHYVQRVEQGRQGCNPFVARKMAEVLEVNLEEPRAAPVTKAAGTEGVHQGPGGPSSSKTSYAGYPCTGRTSSCSLSGRWARLTWR